VLEVLDAVLRQKYAFCRIRKVLLLSAPSWLNDNVLCCAGTETYDAQQMTHQGSTTTSVLEKAGAKIGL